MDEKKFEVITSEPYPHRNWTQGEIYRYLAPGSEVVATIGSDDGFCRVNGYVLRVDPLGGEALLLQPYGSDVPIWVTVDECDLPDED